MKETIWFAFGESGDQVKSTIGPKDEMFSVIEVMLQSSSLSVTFNVTVFTESAENVLTGEAIYFNASASYNPDGSIVNYFWGFGDKTNATGLS